MTDEDWVKVATVDDTVVAELLLKLKQVKQQQQPPEPKPALSLEWRVRQRRSKAVLVPVKKQAPRASPTTPLSWSGATSVSGGVGGGSGSGGSVDGGPEEESSRPSPLARSSTKRSDISRSKVIGTIETVTTKKSRRKKTLAELKEEEDLLQKERRQLKRDLATLRLNLEKERARNENLKRIKLGLPALPAVENNRIVTSEFTISDQLPRKMASLEPVPALLPPSVASAGGSLHSSPPNGCSEGKEELTAGKFVLPDLNIAVEENSSSDALCGVS